MDQTSNGTTFGSLVRAMITICEEIDFGDGWIARRVQTYGAAQFWLGYHKQSLDALRAKNNLVHIENGGDKDSFARMKDMIYTLRRLKFSPQTHSFLKTANQKKTEEDELKKKNQQALDNIK